MTLDKDDLDGRKDWFYPHQIEVGNLLKKLTEGVKLGEVAVITASQGTGKSFWDSMTPYERKVWLNKEFGK